MEFLDQTFTVQSVGIAAGVAARQISDWATRGLISEPERGGGVKGSARHYSFAILMQAAVAVRAMEQFDLTPSPAFQIARLYSHIGDEDRIPSLPYHQDKGTTFLFVSKDGGQVVLTPDGCVDLQGFPPRYQDAPGFLVINLSHLFAQVMTRLGIHPFEALDAAYGVEEVRA